MMTGQIIAALSINEHMLPEEIVEGYTTSLNGKVQFGELGAVRLNGRAAVYPQGVTGQSLTNCTGSHHDRT